MDTGKSNFLANLESELTATRDTPKASLKTHKPGFKKHWLALALGVVGSFLVVPSSPAQAACTHLTPNPVAYNHTKRCGLAYTNWYYQRTEINYTGRTVCYYHHGYTFACSYTNRVDLGVKRACKSY